MLLNNAKKINPEHSMRCSWPLLHLHLHGLRAKSATPFGELRRVGIPIELTLFRGLKHVRIPILLLKAPNSFTHVGLYFIDPLPPFGAA